MESTDWSSGWSPQLQLPPGFRFHPTDEELVVHYLKRKAASAPLPVTIIAEVDLYKFDPWELPSKATFGEQEWYFFSPRDRKYPNGARPNRAATSGYWKATGTDKPILSSNGAQKVGVKKALVFYNGKPPKGIKTNWIMHEYRLIQNHLNQKPHHQPADFANKKASLRLDDWVLCRIYKKNNSQRPMDREKEDSTDSRQNLKPSASKTASHGSLLDNEDNFFDGIITGDGMQNNNSISHHQFVSSSSKLNNMSMASASTTTTTTFPVKQLPLPPQPPQYWNHSGKRFHDYLNSSSGDENNNSYVSLLNQLPQGASFHTNMALSSLGDGVLRPQFQLPSMNWNS